MVFLLIIMPFGFDKLEKGFIFGQFLIYTILENTVIYY